MNEDFLLITEMLKRPLTKTDHETIKELVERYGVNVNLKCRCKDKWTDALVLLREATAPRELFTSSGNYILAQKPVRISALGMRLFDENVTDREAELANRYHPGLYKKVENEKESEYTKYED